MLEAQHRYNRRIILIISISSYFLFMMFPRMELGFWSYLPSVILLLAFVYAVIQSRSVPTYSLGLLVYAVYHTLISYIAPLYNNQADINFINISFQSMKLFFPFFSMIIGSWLSKQRWGEKIITVLFVFLVIQVVLIVLQVNVPLFRELSFRAYRPTLLERYLKSFDYADGGRVIGSIGNPNELAFIAVIISSVIVFSLKTKQGSYQALYLAGATLLLCWIVLLLSQSRTGIAFFALALFVFGGSWISSLNFKYKRLLLLVFPLLALLLFVALNEMTQRGFNLYSMITRTNIWEEQLQSMPTLSDSFVSNFFGLGYQTTRAMGIFDNQYIRTFITGGFLGLTLLLLTMAHLLIVSFRVKAWKVKGLLVLLLVFWISGSLVSDFQELLKSSFLNFCALGYLFECEMNQVTDSKLNTGMR